MRSIGWWWQSWWGWWASGIASGDPALWVRVVSPRSGRSANCVSRWGERQWGTGVGWWVMRSLERSVDAGDWETGA